MWLVELKYIFMNVSKRKRSPTHGNYFFDYFDLMRMCFLKTVTSLASVRYI